MAKIEWKSQTEIDEEKFRDESKPSEEELKKAQLELYSLNLLTDLGVI